MTQTEATGGQIAFLTFALLLLVVPLNSFILDLLPQVPERALVARTMPLLIAGFVFLVVPALRRACIRDLSTTIPAARMPEAIGMSCFIPLHGFAWAGLWILWWHAKEGPVALEQRLLQFGTHDAAMAEALTTTALLFHFVLGAIVAPLVEELLFRGFLYRAWERQYGWLASAVLTSSVFGLFHPNFVPAFVASMFWVCLYRRTGTLRACIASHMVGNIAAHYAILGQFVFPRDLYAPGDLASWKFQVAMLGLFAVAMPVYLFMSRNENARHLQYLHAHAPLPR